MILIKGFCSLNPIFKLFFISCTLSSLLTVYFIFNSASQTIYGIMSSSITMILLIIYLIKFASYPSKWKKGEILLLILIFITVFHLPSHFIASSSLTYKSKPKDELLMTIDKYLLGWLIKDGQISLWIDNNNIIGRHKLLGKFINNTLQIIYFFYYLVPYITMHFINLLNCVREFLFRYQNKGFKSESYQRNWNNSLFLFSTYLLNCFFVFFVNTLIPATSPRKYLKRKFRHPLILSGLGKFLNQKCKEEKSANSFPSGHVAETLSIALSYIATKEYDIGLTVLIISFFISLATLFLRYHYFCDILIGIFLAILSFFINYCFGYKIYYKNISKIKREKNKNIKIINYSPESKEQMVLSEEIDTNFKL